jgi:hypothetical protein
MGSPLSGRPLGGANKRGILALSPVLNSCASELEFSSVDLLSYLAEQLKRPALKCVNPDGDSWKLFAPPLTGSVGVCLLACMVEATG